MINKIFKEVDKAVDDIYSLAAETQERKLVIFSLNLIESIKRLKMNLEATGLFTYKEHLTFEQVNQMLNFQNNESN